MAQGQFSIMRLFYATAWLALAAMALRWFPFDGSYPPAAALFAFMAAAGAGLGALAGKPVKGAVLALLGYLLYAALFPDRRN